MPPQTPQDNNTAEAQIRTLKFADTSSNSPQIRRSQFFKRIRKNWKIQEKWQTSPEAFNILSSTILTCSLYIYIYI